VTEVALALLVLGAAGFVARLVRGPRLADRVVALDGLLAVVVAAIVVAAAGPAGPVVLDAVLVVALVGFVGTGVVARLLERRGR
jgi:multicomponent Na+:H+ antiporter subunit F